MAAQMKCKAAFSSVRAAPVARARVVRVAAQKQESSLALAAVTFAATALLSGAADAKVVLEQPTLKKVFQSDAAPSAPAPASIPTLASGLIKKQAPAPKAAAKASEESSSEGVDPRLLALPLSLGAIAAGFVAVTKLDDGFTDFLDRTVVRDSNDYAGFEVALKEGRLPGQKKSGTSFKLPAFGGKK